MSRSLAAVIGGAAGAFVLVGLVIVLLWLYILRPRSLSRASETGSSEPSFRGQNISTELSRRGISLTEFQGVRAFTFEELVTATNDFSNVNLIGVGKFGEVYKGLLHDGMVVAIKKRKGVPSQEFIEEVCYLSSIKHRHIVVLLGYCQEKDQQMLVYEHIPNGSVFSHLHGQTSSSKLEFKHRLSIALGAARGLSYLHGLNPPLLHKNLNTKNVLVDENFIAKVADAGLWNLMRRIDPSGPSTQTVDPVFLDPEVTENQRFSEKSDVYSFGVFIFELISGREAQMEHLGSESLVLWAQNFRNYDEIAAIVDPRMTGSFTDESMIAFINLAVQCTALSSERRPAINYVLSEIDRILENEMNLTTVMGEGTPTVTLGSQLFTRAK